MRRNFGIGGCRHSPVFVLMNLTASFLARRPFTLAANPKVRGTAFAAASALALLCAALPSVSQAATFLGQSELNYAGPPYCSNPCLTGAYPTAGTVTVTVESGANSYLHFEVDLAPGFTFINNHGTSFGFGLDVSGASITNITLDPAGGTWTPQSNVLAGDGVGKDPPWSYGLFGTHKISNDLEFDVSKPGVDLTLADLIQTLDKHGVALWFIADVSNPLGKTGYVGATTTEPTLSGGIEAPLPGALPLFAGGIGLLGLLGLRRRRKPQTIY